MLPSELCKRKIISIQSKDYSPIELIIDDINKRNISLKQSNQQFKSNLISLSKFHQMLDGTLLCSVNGGIKNSFCFLKNENSTQNNECISKLKNEIETFFSISFESVEIFQNSIETQNDIKKLNIFKENYSQLKNVFDQLKL